jgi:hypothetical protein
MEQPVPFASPSGGRATEGLRKFPERQEGNAGDPGKRLEE